jgi:Tol biopolymer transport system component/DNA-binding winged helix-turn-helix (wHTH) protein
MTSEPKSTPRVVFGPFQLDVSSGELRKHGMRLRMTGQSLTILEVLLERPNQVVAREELHQRLWKGTTFVDFNQGLNAAINKLRQTLGDSADQPRYVETVPGKGYRFVAPLSHDSLQPPAPITALSPPPDVSFPVSPEVQDTGFVPESNGISPDAPLRGPKPSLKPTKPFHAALVLGVAITIATGVLFFVRFARTPSATTISVTRPVRYQIAIPDGLQLSSDQLFSISPDGRNLVYFARKISGGPFVLWVQSLDQIKPRSLPIHQDHDSVVFWSPDSKSIAFGSEGKLKRADLTGNPAQEIGSLQENIGGAWAKDGTTILGTLTSAIVRVDYASGGLLPVTVRDTASDRAHIFPVFLPDGRHFLYSRTSTNVSKMGVYVGSLDVKPEQQSLTPLIATPFAAQFAASNDGKGIILFQRETTLWAQKYDTSLLRLTGEPQMVAERLGNTRAFGFFAASSGVLVHRSGVAQHAQLTWLDRRGQQLGTLGAAFDAYDNPALISPDGSKIVMTRSSSDNTDIWVHDLSRDVTQRITSDPAPDQSPIWSPDGKKLVFSSSRGGHFDLYQTSSSGDGGQQLLYASSENKYASSWSPDGRFILFSTEKRDGIWVLSLEGAGKHTAVSLQSQANERWGVFSPDSRWIAYVSDESGQPDVYVQRFSLPGSGSPGGPKVLISRSGGTSPHWRADGKEIFYRSADGTLVSVPLATDPALRPGVPKRMFAIDRLWEATRDGNRFLVSVPVEQGVSPFTVVLNWQSELKN